MAIKPISAARHKALEREHVYKAYLAHEHKNSSKYKVMLIGGQFYRLLEWRSKTFKGKSGKRSHWVTVAIGTKALYRVCERLNGIR